MGEVLNFVTLEGCLKKMTQFLDLFWLSFGLKDLF